jgi:hypothetical protein
MRRSVRMVLNTMLHNTPVSNSGTAFKNRRFNASIVGQSREAVESTGRTRVADTGC